MSRKKEHPSCDECRECDAYKQMIEDAGVIGELIDYQLNIDEIDTVAKALERLEMYCGLYLSDKKQLLDQIKAIRGKLEKQKEMWEVEK